MVFQSTSPFQILSIKKLINSGNIYCGAGNYFTNSIIIPSQHSQIILTSKTKFKIMKHFIILAISSLWYLNVNAQSTTTDDEKPKDKVSISIGSKGINVSKGDKNIVGKKKKRDRDRISSTLGFDLGFNSFDNSKMTTNFLHQVANPGAIAGTAGNVNSLDINAYKSINVALYPFMYSIHLYKKSVNINTGLGFNWFNYRYENDVKPIKMLDSATGISYDAAISYNSHNANLSKNKLASSYLTLPISLQFKPKIGRNRFVIGGGVSVGYLLKGWNKSKTSSGSKDHQSISYAFNPWQVNAIAEIGIDDKIRLYGSYGITDYYKTPLKQKQISFGIRFFGL
jgi:Outer membrane protein beta-barrel domain